MVKLQATSTRIFVKLLDKLETNTTLEICVPHASALRLLARGKVTTIYGNGRLVSIGTLAEDNAQKYIVFMEFIVIDRRRGAKTSFERVSVYPRYFRDDVNGIEDEAVFLEGTRIKYTNKVSQISLVRFAYGWLADLLTEGYVAQYPFITN